MRLHSLVAAGLILSTPPALADSDLSWSGLYGGLEAGVSWSNVDWRNAPDRGSVLFDNGLGTNGVVSALAGYRVSLGNDWIGGIEFAFTPELGKSGSTACAVRDNTTCSGEFSNAFSLSGTLGRPFTDHMLGYVKLGISSAEIETLSEPNPGFDLMDLTTSHREMGFNVGAGVDFRVNSNVLVGAGYTYHRFNSSFAQVQPSPPSTAIRKPDGPDAHVVGVRLLYQFW
ncbi:MAG: porin family protein [Hyphomonas sp.]|nr:porin family protein [Hyphomonas sp.]